MTLLLERARSRKPVTWLSILGILLLPAVVGGILVAALQNPTERLESMTAAIVNLDEPVTIDEQLTPLGRQLASGLVKGSENLDSNLTWVISNKRDAADGLADGSYQAVVTIPEDFSATATSAGQAISDASEANTDASEANTAAVAEQATITVTTPEDGRVADDLITAQIANVAASTMGTALSEATTENILVGFTTIGDQIGDAADGALRLANGLRDAASGAAALPDGANKLASGAGELRTGASSLASGLETIADKTRAAASGAAQIGSGLSDGAAALTDPATPFGQLVGAATAGGPSLQSATAQSADTAANLGSLAAGCEASGASVEYCAEVSQAAAVGAEAAKSAATAQAYLGPLSTGLPAAADTLASKMSQAGASTTQLANGLTQLANQGISASAAGARELASGAVQLSTGATALTDGTTTLASGLDTLASGTGDLAGGLRTASDSLPSFSDSDSRSLASVIADPVTSNLSKSTIFGSTAIPLLTAVALWFGALATFVVMRPYTARTLTSRRSSAALALRSFAPAAIIGAGQGLLVSLTVQIVAGYDDAAWWAFAGTAVLTGIMFAAVNQALVALFGGVGRWLSALVGVLAVATGLISTVPGWLAGVGAALPTAPAFAGLIAASGSAVTAVVVWGLLSLMATTLAVTLRRTTSVKAVLATL